MATSIDNYIKAEHKNLFDIGIVPVYDINVNFNIEYPEDTTAILLPNNRILHMEWFESSVCVRTVTDINARVSIGLANIPRDNINKLIRDVAKLPEVKLQTVSVNQRQGVLNE